MGDRRFLWSLGAGIAVVALQAAWVVWNLGGAELTAAFSNVVGIPVPLAASGACWLAAVRQRGADKRGWVLLGLGTFSWAIGAAIWTYHETVRHEAPFPSFADAGFLALAPFAGIALVSFPSMAVSVVSRARTVLDILFPLSSLLFISWATVVGPMYEAGFGSGLEQALAIAYPAGDLALLVIVIYVLARAPRGGRTPFLLVGGGIALIAVADSAFIALSLTGSFATGGIIDVGWTAGFVLIGLGAMKGRMPQPARRTNDRRPTRLAILLPYAALLAGMGLATHHQIVYGYLTAPLFWIALLSFVLLALRQLLVLLENVALNRDLEGKVRSRTAEIAERERRFRALVQNSSDLVSIVDPRGTIVYQSSAERVLGYDPATLTRTQLEELVHPEDRPTMVAAISQLLGCPGATMTLTYRIRRADGSWIQTETIAANLLHEPGVEGIVLNTRDVSERSALETQLVHQAFHDSLTGLANRALFRDRVEHARARATRGDGSLAVLFLDLDDFKAVNDAYGHGSGDALLVAVAHRIAGAIRPGDTAARLGGDEFAVLLEDALPAWSATEVAERIITELRAPVTVGGRTIRMTASIGVAVTDDSQASADDLLRNADVAMYVSKARGKNRATIFEPRMHRTFLERAELAADLDHAIEHGEFVLHFQSIHELTTERMVGAEALLRWDHPRRGMIAPEEFISIAEQTGHITAIGRWAIEAAARECVRWRRETGDDLSVSVNLSARQLEDRRLVAQVADVLQRTGLPPAALTLEITESLVMEDTELSFEILNELKEVGITLAIDDFGTGYSSLAYLRRFPFDIIKIDRAFVAMVAGAAEDTALVRAIVHLGRTFRLRVVAEGVERPAQLSLLRAMGCGYGQGFLFTRPEAAASFVEKLRRPLAATGDMFA